MGADHDDGWHAVIDEAARNELYNRLEAAIGADPTSTLMTLLPPVGWADVATKDDLRHLERNMRAEVISVQQTLGTEMHEMRGDMHNAMRQQTLTLIGAMLTISGLTVAVSAVF